ncbi:MAG: extracellular matrix/biofilm biosynthesis regulator RemA family protein [Monoglobales bacterium]
MYLHIGSDLMVHSDDIVSILDFENTTTSKITREFLAVSQEEDFIVNVSEEDLPKSFIVTERDGKTTVYISPISSATLLKRIKENAIGL